MTTAKREEFVISGERLLAKVKALIKEGNVRRIIIRSKDGHNVAVFPVTAGVVGALLAPVLAAVGAIAALLTECVIVVERRS